MAASNIQVTQGSGTRLATNSYTEGGVTVHDEKMILGEPYLASYTVAFQSVSIATVDSHIIQIMAGASLNLRIRRIRLYQSALASAASTALMITHRLTTAGTGGTSITARPFDTGDAAAGATAQTLPTAKGTEGVFLERWSMGLLAAQPITTVPFEWTQLPNQKPIVISAGVTNGFVIKNATAVTGATVSGWVEFDETSF